ncbi:HEPN domain-containing protein [Oleomonas cavernae]|uniref:HEPN domain-containing protein n=1 Tax=Oleomonas cavernae TaxID=2320859 RepID=UPI0018F3FD44|nr:HEPN domain-containing protein [Oleomonas cavernae]
MTVQSLLAKAEQAAASALVLLEIGDADGACNRAYFAMFDAARAALLAAGHDVGKTHKGVLNAFSNHLIKDGPLPKELGRLLKQAETRRYVADYDGDSVKAADAREMIGQATTFIAALRDGFLRGA